jgi:hypothetical protein
MGVHKTVEHVGYPSVTNNLHSTSLASSTQSRLKQGICPSWRSLRWDAHAAGACGSCRHPACPGSAASHLLCMEAERSMPFLIMLMVSADEVRFTSVSSAGSPLRAPEAWSQPMEAAPWPPPQVPRRGRLKARGSTLAAGLLLVLLASQSWALGRYRLDSCLGVWRGRPKQVSRASQLTAAASVCCLP